ncbi:hypothetical protein LTR70_008391 [Exophiala xenobiotica]|uniref:NmrA-like domain-containing protein n=1 Tax=Lithohypha guttulata TaxID=1690604 RepID=A0ABR0K1U8_9EURO|nr:hypothetical protein LTR24_008003 [Lithohypha guttulata]KAK5312132.1 hypothetical protein LTR70_008391 [Exophiala xenobiotica]
MVKIALAGGTGQVAREVIDALLARNKHEPPTTEDGTAEVTFLTVDYNDTDSLAKALLGVHTVLSFIQVHSDPQNKSQKNLIDATIVAGATRFAPSEWAGSTLTDMSLHAGKAEIREYLEKVNEKGKVLEYTLFQPGLFLNYLAAPYQTAKYVAPLQTMFDYQGRRGIVIDEHDPIFTFTTVEDLAAIVANAIEYDGEWPVIGGISGNRVPISKIIEIGEKVRGGSFIIDHVNVDDLQIGKLKMSWMPAEGHRSFNQEQAAKIIEQAYIGILLSSTKGAWDVSNDFNQLFPDYEFTQIEAYLNDVWKGKP